MRLDGCISAVITGGASGLGEVTARRLAASGVRVALFDLNEAKGQAVAAELGLTPADVAAAVREQNTQSAAGRLGDEPMNKRVDLTLSVTTQGRLADPEQFDRIGAVLRQR